MRGLESRKFAEQIRTLVDITDTDALDQCMDRNSQLKRRGYKLVDKGLEGNEQYYIWEKGEKVG